MGKYFYRRHIEIFFYYYSLLHVLLLLLLVVVVVLLLLWAKLVEQKIRTITLQKHAYSNILKILPPKNENFQIKNSDVFHISAQNIDCGNPLEPPQRGGSNAYPQSMF